MSSQMTELSAGCCLRAQTSAQMLRLIRVASLTAEPSSVRLPRSSRADWFVEHPAEVLSPQAPEGVSPHLPEHALGFGTFIYYGRSPRYSVASDSRHNDHSNGPDRLRGARLGVSAGRSLRHRSRIGFRAAAAWRHRRRPGN